MPQLRNQTIRAIYVKTSDYLPDRIQDLKALITKAYDAEYNCLVAWDTEHTKANPDSGYPKATEAIQALLDSLKWDLFVETCYTGRNLQNYPGMSDAFEPDKKFPEPFCCLNEPAVFEAWGSWLKTLKGHFPAANGIMFHYDEIRAAKKDSRCQNDPRTPGKMLADHLRRSVDLAQSINQDWILSIWSDMFDPFENGRAGDYYDVPGGWNGSWDGLDPNMLVWYWNTKGETAAEGAKFFSDRGNPLVFCGYYDGPDGDGLSARDERDLLVEVASGSGADLAGYMYTTWNADYSKLNEYAPHENRFALDARSVGVIKPVGFQKRELVEAIPEVPKPQSAISDDARSRISGDLREINSVCAKLAIDIEAIRTDLSSVRSRIEQVASLARAATADLGIEP